MSKILKANSIKVDSDNKINIEIPNFGSNAMFNQKVEPVQKVNHAIDFQNFDELSATDDTLVDGFSFDEYLDDNRSEQNPDEIIKNANAEAEKIIEDANAKAESIINDALQSANSQKEEIFENAKNDGYKSGMDMAEQEIASLKEEAQQIRDDAISEKEQMLDSVEGEVVGLISDIVQKLLSKTLNIDNSIIFNLIKQGLSQTTITGQVFIRVCYDDYENVLENKDEFSDFIDSNTSLEVVKDMSLNKGDCVIETPFGNIDCSLSQQFEGLKNSLYYILGNG